jgi:peptide chain release factor 1
MDDGDNRELIFRATRKDFRVDTFRGTGPGGQHRNKTDSAVRMTHIATGISAEAKEHRSQHQNKVTAFRRVAKKLIAHVLGEQRKARWASGFETVRTYHEPDNRVTDHRTGARSTWDRIIGDARLEEMWKPNE